MVTASHNPKAYTGVKLVREGALALSGDAGIGDVQALIDGGPARAAGRRRGRGRSTSTTTSSEHALAFDRPERDQAAAGRRRRRQRDGRADGRPAARAPRPRPGRDLLGPRRRVPRPRAEPAAAREPPVHHRPGARPRAPTSGSPGTATPTAASSSTTRASSSTATSSPRCSPAACSPSSPARRSSTTSAPAARSPTRSRAAAGPRTSTGSATRSSSSAMREHGAAFGGEVSGHYYFRDFWCADSGTLPGAARARAALGRGQAAVGARRRVARALLHLRRDQLRGRRPGGAR